MTIDTRTFRTRLPSRTGEGSRLPRPVPPGRRRVARALLGLSAILAAALAAMTAATLLEGRSSPLSLLAAAGVLGGVALVGLAVVSIEAFVLVVLVARASLDALKLGPAAPGGLDPAAALAVLFALAVTLWLVAQRRENTEHTSITTLDKALLLFIAAAFLGVVVSPQPAVSLVEWARIACTAPMLLLIERLAQRRQSADRILVAVYASAAIPLVVAGYQAVSGTGVFVAGGFDRVRGTFTHSNPFSVFLVVLLVMAVAVLPHVHRRVQIGLVVFLAAAAPALLATYTRGAWIAAFVGLAVVGALQSRRLLAGLVAGVVAVLIAVPSIGARFADLGETTQISGTPGNSLSWRMEYWTEALSLAERSPIAGVGLKMVAADTEEGKQPHNDFIRAYVELGVLGLAAYLGLLTALVRSALRALRATAARSRPNLDRGLAVGFAGVVTAFIVLSLVANVMSQVVILWYFLAFAGLTLAVTRRAEQAGGAQQRREEGLDADPARQ